MKKPPMLKPTVVQVSPHETLIVFPRRPGVTLGTTCNLPFDEIKHLLTDWPLRRPYGGEPRRKPKAPHKRRRKPRAE